MKKYASLLVLIAFASAFVACGDDPVGKNTKVLLNPDDTPTEAYKRLFAAVKSKNTEAIRAEMSEKTRSFAEFVAEQRKTTVDVVFANGFTQTTFADTLPEIRDQRINGNLAAIEVWSAKGGQWEDLPYVREESGWKLAIGDAFQGSWTSPSQGRAAREKEAANAISGNNSMANGLPNVSSRPNSNLNK
jgi:hypothetical protein